MPVLITKIHEIAASLHAKRTPTGWVACCPAHEDHTPSLSLRESNGKILVRCHAGCTQEEVLEALRKRGLWPEPSRRPGSPGETADPDRAEDMLCAAYWARSVVMLAECLLEDIPLTDPARGRLTELVRVIRLGDESALAEYRRWRENRPDWTKALVHAGRLHDARQQRALARWIQEGMHGEFS